MYLISIFIFKYFFRSIYLYIVKKRYDIIVEMQAIIMPNLFKNKIFMTIFIPPATKVLKAIFFDNLKEIYIAPNNPLKISNIDPNIR